MSLTAWLENGWLQEHKPDRQEIRHLFHLIDRDLIDCRKSALSPDWRFNIAYNATLQCANAVLIASGFKAAKDGHHFRVIQSLKFTLEIEENSIKKIDAFRKKRNISEYNQAGTISTRELEEMIAVAESLRQSVNEWMNIKHPEFANDGI